MTNATLQINLDDLKFHSFHGVGAQERIVGNEFKVCFSGKMIMPEGIMDDNIESTVSYADIYEVISEEMARPSRLLESVAYRMVERIKSEWTDFEKIELSVEKTSVPVEGMDGKARIKIFWQKNV